MADETLFTVFFAVWMVVILSGAIFNWRVRDAALKRRVYPWIVWGAGALLAGFFLLTGGLGMWFILPPLALGVWFGTRNVQFCDACGRTILPQYGGWSRADFCPKCGAALGTGHDAEGSGRLPNSDPSHGSRGVSVSRRMSEEARRERD